MSARRWPAWAWLFALGVDACQSSPRPLVPGEDVCRYCRMTIDDSRFGGMLVTPRGRLETFDSIECLAAYVGDLPDSAQAHTVLVADFEHPARWVDVTHARFLYRGHLRSPMGRELAAFGGVQATESLQAHYGGEVIGWTDVLARVRRDRFTPSGAERGARRGAAFADPSHSH